VRRRLVLLLVVSAATAVAVAYYIGKRSRQALGIHDEWLEFGGEQHTTAPPRSTERRDAQADEEAPTDAPAIVVATMEAATPQVGATYGGNGSGSGIVEPEPARASAEPALGSIALRLDSPRRRRLSGVTLAVFGALAGAAAIGLGAWGIASTISDEDSNSTPTTPLALENVQQVVSLYTKPRSTMIPIQGSGRSIILVVGAKGYGVLVLNGVQQPPSGKTYEAWVIVPKAAPRPAGLFAGGSGVVELTKRVPKGAIVAITVEKAGGVPAPTSQPKLLATRT
jgi:hypothetical protein